MKDFSVVMSVYKNDNPVFFEKALNSISFSQTIIPKEIILVVDGPVSNEINAVIKKHEELTGFLRTIRLTENHGLGKALKIAVDSCSCDLIARMDSDDISLNDRFEQQLKLFDRYPDIDVIGGDITEFVNDEINIVARRSVPTTDSEIKKYIKKRCPFNHVTVMYKRDAVISSGGYKDWFWNEDYFLWVRMVEHDCKMMNTGTVLVNVRTGRDMYKRRGGFKYFRSEVSLQKYMLKQGLITRMIFISNVAKRFLVQILIPGTLRGVIYKLFARERGC